MQVSGDGIILSQCFQNSFHLQYAIDVYIINYVLLLYLQIFEWWYFKKYGTSFIEQVSLNHISPLLGGEPANGNENTNGTSTSGNSNGNSNGNNNSQGQQSMPGIN